jgi:hypothetical protein
VEAVSAAPVVALEAVDLEAAVSGAVVDLEAAASTAVAVDSTVAEAEGKAREKIGRR